MKTQPIFPLFMILNQLLCIIFFIQSSFSASYDGPLYDSRAYLECKMQPEAPLYKGGILKGYNPTNIKSITTLDQELLPVSVYSPAIVLTNLNQSIKYSFSTWVKIKGAKSSLIRAKLWTGNSTSRCIGSVLAKKGCWSFLKGGFELDSTNNLSVIYFQHSDVSDVDISVASLSLQPFTNQQWKVNQDYRISKDRKRAVTIHVSDKQGARLQGAQITVEQISKDFPFGSAIASSILGNLPYQKWFIERFNTAVFENELKWYATESEQGKLNYTLADRMLEFVRANQISVRGHNIFWEDSRYTPSWVRNLTSNQLKFAVNSRIQSLMTRYRGDFMHWDVNNEMLHHDFYEQRLGQNVSLEFFKTAHKSDPLATLFMNDYNVVETCGDDNSTADSFISRLKELQIYGVKMDGIGLEAHFSIPNLPLMRATLDKLSRMGLPIWLTEVDIKAEYGKEKQAIYLEQVMREGFSHPSVNGIMLWSALHPDGCYRMCLTDNDFRNLPTGNVVDKLLKEWKTGEMNVQTDQYGSFSFYGFLGEYKVNVKYGDKFTESTFSLLEGDETKHFNVQL